MLEALAESSGVLSVVSSSWDSPRASKWGSSEEFAEREEIEFMGVASRDLLQKMATRGV